MTNPMIKRRPAGQTPPPPFWDLEDLLVTGMTLDTALEELAARRSSARPKPTTLAAACFPIRLCTATVAAPARLAS